MSTKQSLKNRKNRKYNKRWVIVSFTESNDYSVVPVNWLILPPTLELTADNISIVELCRWPPFNVTSIELTNADDPEDLWGLFKIKILSSKIYVNFKEAWHQRVEIESSATENEPKVLKKKKKNRQRSSSEDDDSDFEDCSISVTPISKKLKKDVPLTYTELLVRNSDEEFNCELDSVLPPAVEIAASSSVSYIINDDIHMVKNTDEIQLYEPFIVPNTSYSTTSTGSLNQKILDILTNMQLEQVNIKKELVASNLILNRLLTKVEVLETNSKNNIESNIVNEVDFVLKLESFIKSIGGCGLKNNITRVLQKIFSDEFAVISTWTGRGKHISITIGSSEVIKLIKRFIKANSNDVLTDSEFEITVANWLRHANTRLSRAK
ncbi:unnamed protein product [Macrosiphum euphorbiae]|uniref:DUF4806 domain-containing protein n=1 Tax=Macrosiphum euphorbiae TaxID=13131 RepID=A0AAV0Y481_9HEMI|nr:unnamed protein product [Macrosiphum euphorbiae]